MSSMEDQLFYTITEGQELIPLSQFISVSHQHFHDSSVLHTMEVQTFHGMCGHAQVCSALQLL